MSAFGLKCMHLPKSRSFLVATLCRPGQTSKYYDKDFTTKFNVMLDVAATEGKEMLLLGDFRLFTIYTKIPVFPNGK